MRQVLYVLLTRSPLSFSGASTRKTSLDLHVLGTPPAFVLSQDQTLIKSLSSHSFLSLTDLLFFSLFSTITLVIVPCTLVRLVQFSKVFVTQSLSSDNYISISQLLTYVNTFLKLFLLFSSLRYTHSPYGIRTRVTAVKRRCLNPLTNGPELVFSTLTIIPTFCFLSTPFLNFFYFFA